MPVKIATPVSHLFNDNETAKELMLLSDILELRENSEIKKNMKGPYLFHSRLNILAKWYPTQVQQLKKIENDNIELISFHIMSCYQKNGILKIHGREIQFGLEDKMSYEEMSNNIKHNIKIVKDIFGKKIKIQVENIPYLLTNAYDRITDADFISSIVNDNNLYFLLDIPHAVITSINTNKDYMEYIQSLPLNKCLQLHISSWSLDGKYAVDSHDKMNNESWNIFNEVFKLVKNNVKYVTIEYYKHKEALKKQLIQLKEMIR